MVAAKENSMRLVCCRAGEQLFFLDTMQLASIHQTDVLRREPDRDDRIIGYVNVRGGDMPTFELSRLLGCGKASQPDREYIVVVQSPYGPWGLLVESVSRPFAAGRNDVVPVPQIASRFARSCFDGVVRIPQVTSRTVSPTDSDTRGLESSAINHTLALLLAPDRVLADDAQPPVRIENSIPAANATVTMPATTKRHTKGRMLAFQINDRLVDGLAYSVAFSILQVVEIMQPQSLLPVPGSNQFLCGLVDWRGTPVAVIDLARLLGLPNSSEPREQRLVIVRCNRELIVGFLAHAQIRAIGWPLKVHAIPPGPGLNTQLIRATFLAEDGALIVPRLAELGQSPLAS
jgi:chemotaxis signal transduction protein